MASYASYAWLITKDHSPDPNAPEGSYLNAPGVSGPSNADPALLDYLKAGHGYKFRIKDDDGEVYYEGRMIERDADDATGLLTAKCTGRTSEHYTGLICTAPFSEEGGFGALWDFAAPNAGATSIEYWVGGKGGGWAGL